jgi:uncharacterized protein DUF4397
MMGHRNLLPVERAMHPLRFFALLGVAFLVAGCSKDATFVEPIPPLAAIHFVEAVPDTNPMDFRVVDIVSNAGLFDAPFRTANMFYTGIEAGNRKIRVFISSSDPNVTGVPIYDTTFAFTANTDYTFIHTGFARTGQAPARTVWIVTDNAPAPAAGQVGVRVMHAGAGLGAVDFNLTHRAADTLPDAPLLGNVSYSTVSNYLLVGADTAAADSLRIVVTAAGTKAPVLFTLKLPTGVPGTSSANPIAGARVSGSVMSVVVVPASVVGSQAPQGGAFAAPNGVVLVDRRPPNTAP